ncbi:APC family permease [Pseudotabrizicola sp. 4114]|uniref:APC family permease n=1 Tax=Pseudotabrizicola sp. 4114 TaxID=2817731 RepID=UPI0028618792|nr:amino acid transporter [Pseudorhodobacter sp. 4114]
MSIAINAKAGSVSAVTDASDEQLDRGVLNTSSIVFMVLAVSAPLAVVVALMPIALAFGNGAGVPGAWLLCAVAMLLFAVGYVRQIPYVKNAGAFYAYISASIGRVIGLPAAYVAAVSYMALCISTLAALAFFCGDMFAMATGIDTPWQLWAFINIILVVWLAYHRITMVATVLAFALLAEIAAIMALNVAIIMRSGFPAFNLGDFAPSSVFAPGLGIALIYAFNSMIGFEGTAIYQEEARNRKTTVPRATFIAVIIAGLLYAITAWCLSTAVGSLNVSSIAAADPGHFVTARANDFLGSWSVTLFGLLVVTSAFAAVLGLFNNSARYIYALARDGVLPARLAKTHPVYKSPHVSAIFLGAVLVVSTAIAASAGLDPLLNISPMFVGVGSIGLMVLLMLTALGIPVFFAKRGVFGWTTTVAPGIGGLAIAGATYLAATNYSALTGVDSPLVNGLPLILVAASVIGFAQALWLRSNRKEAYEMIGASRIEDTTN